jgi:hypothetical protein
MTDVSFCAPSYEDELGMCISEGDFSVGLNEHCEGSYERHFSLWVNRASGGQITLRYGMRRAWKHAIIAENE